MVRLRRKLIAIFDKLAHPLHLLSKHDPEMRWRPKHTCAPHDLMQSLVNATNLNIVDLGKPITIKTATSKHATGAVLEQEGRPIAFEFRKVTQRDQTLPAYESE